MPVECFFGTKVVLYGEKFSPEERAIVISNHRCRLDWMFYWMIQLRVGRLGNAKIILKDDLKWLPGPGKFSLVLCLSSARSMSPYCLPEFIRFVPFSVFMVRQDELLLFSRENFEYS